MGAELWRRGLLRAALVGVGGSGTSVVLEFSNRHGAAEVLHWVTRSPLEATCNAMFAVLLAWGALALTGRAVVSLLISMGVLGVLGAVHAAKLQILGKPLFPWDLVLQYREALALGPQMSESIWGQLALVLAFAVVMAIIGAARWEKSVLPWGLRLTLFAVVSLSCWAIFPKADQTLSHLGIHHVRWQQSESYRVNGLLLGIALNANSAVVVSPAGYSAKSVRAALGNPPRVVSRKAEAPPTVIVLMSESFFDPTRLPKVKFLDEPIPTVRRLQREYTSGTLFSPVFGGGTANAEFEVLTGHAMRFLPEGSVPYQQYVRRPHPSLATLFAAQGYQTVAVHNFHRWFWERDVVYRHLGFERFIGLEDMPGGLVDGSYPSDALLTAQLIEQFEARTRPLFMFAISMEAHGPYIPGRYAQQSVRFESELDEGARAQLEAYLEAAHHADRELGALVEYFSKVKSPVTIVFFGDHLPSLPGVLQQTGVIRSLNELELGQLSFIHQVPLLVWTNGPHEPRQLGPLSTSFLGPLVLELTGTPGSRYTDFLSELSRTLPVMSPGLVFDAQGAASADPGAALEPLARAWWLLQYDQLFGEQYLEQLDGVARW